MSRRWQVWLFVLCLALPPVVCAADIPDDIVAEFDVPATMRDGTVLRANVFRPKEGGPFPVLLSRTPYGKGTSAPLKMVRAGYIVVIQDFRGRYASDGEFESFVRPHTHDAEDGYDTVEWAAKLPHSTGKVGTFGQSYLGFAQWRLTATRPPSLVATAAFSINARYQDLEQPGTIRPGRRWAWWYYTMSPDLRKRSGGPPPHTMKEASALWHDGVDEQVLNKLPVIDLPDEMFGGEAGPMKDWLRNPTQEPWYLDRDAARAVVPNLNLCGWYDHCYSSIDLHTAIVQGSENATARQHSRLIVGPWPHINVGKREQNGIDFGPQAAMDLDDLRIRWFDHWLKGIDNGIEKDPQVHLYVIGADTWRDFDVWPPTNTQPSVLYLDGDGSANTPSGDGSLDVKQPEKSAVDRYTYDPRDPVPTLWKPALFTTVADQRPLADRQDILVYESEPLSVAVEAIGYPEVVLHAASDAPDTEFFARLIDVPPEGPPINVAQGMVRARYRNGLDHPELITPGETVEYRIRLQPTAVRFQPGHRIRLDVTSSDFPNYQPNHNTGADQNLDAELRVANQEIHHGGQQASRLILPVMPGTAVDAAK